jgi:hypothetical protein
VLGILLLVSPAGAQELGEIAREFRHNSNALKGYSWTSEVELTRDGKVVSKERYRVSVEDDGTIRRELLDREGKRTKQQESAESSLASIRDLIDAYVNMSSENFRKTFGENPRWVIPGENGEPTRIKTSGVIHGGDSMEIWVDPRSHRLQRFELDTALQQEPARLLVWFEQNEDGVTYVGRSVFYTHEKKASIQIETVNHDVVRAGRGMP